MIRYALLSRDTRLDWQAVLHHEVQSIPILSLLHQLLRAPVLLRGIDSIRSSLVFSFAKVS